VIVREGQMLYLPVGWWHYVQQLPDISGVVVAVNYWYDAEYQGHQMMFLNFMRSLSMQISSPHVASP
jgi:jumonji domain-containing protein 7